MTSGPRLLVRTETFEVLWQSTKAELLQLRQVDSIIFKKAQIKIKQWLKEGIIDHYVLYQSDLATLPQALGKEPSSHLSGEYVFQFTVARGFRHYQGITARRSDKSFASIDISIEKEPLGSEDWNPDEFFLNICHLASREKAPPPSRAATSWLFERWQKTQKKFNHIPIAQIIPSQSKTHLDVLIIDRSYIMVNIHQPLMLTHPDHRQRALDRILSEVKKLKGEFQIDLQKDNIIARIKHAARGKEAIGLAMPLSVFGGNCRALGTPRPSDILVDHLARGPTKTTSQKAATANQSKSKPSERKKAADKGKEGSSQDSIKEAPQGQTPTRPSIPENYPGRGLLQLRISPDKMSAVIYGFDARNFDKYNGDLDDQWLDYELTRYKIKVRTDELLKRIKTNIAQSRDVNELEIAKGKEGEPPSKEQICAVRSDGQKDHDGDLGDLGVPRNDFSERQDMRSSTIHTVKKDQVIAEWTFQKPGVAGEDIFGNPTPPPAADLPEVQCGEGAKFDGKLSFIAQIEGLVLLDAKKLIVDVQKHYVHKGDVSLSTGDIVFDGAVTIKGNIRDKATVKCTGKLTVEKGIADARAISSGDISVGDGVVSSTVSCQGNLNAGFMENSNLVVKGRLTSKRSVMNCQVVAQSIFCQGDPGLVAGGRLFCNRMIIAKSIGFATNNTTEIKMGIDWSYARKFAISNGRVARSEAYLEEKSKELKVFESKSAAQLTELHKEKMRLLKKMVKRLKKIHEAVVRRQRLLKIDATGFNEMAYIAVTSVLVNNVDITMGESQVKMLGDSKAVYITFKPRLDSHIRALPDDYEFDDQGHLIDKSKLAPEMPSKAS